MFLKTNALYPAERVKPCPHRHMVWSGEMPCTGILRCMMCNHTQEEIDADLATTQQREEN